MLTLEGRLAPVSIPRPSSPALRRFGKPAAITVAAALAVWLLTSFWSKPTSSIGQATFWSSSAASHIDPFHHTAEAYWQDVANTLAKYKPTFDKIALNGSPGWLTFNTHEAPPPRPNLIDLTDPQVQDLKSQHAGATTALARLAPQLPFRKGTRGIVTTANNDALTILAASLRMLRKTGSKLPVEIMIDEWETEPCETIFPSLEARCIFIEHFVSGEEVPKSFRFSHFGWKAAVVAFSSFEQVLYLDSDLFPVSRPEALFKRRPFKNKGYVLWPDYWSSSASPYLYQVLGLEMPDMSERASTESGALMIDKNTHAAAVLQALYYNVYGERHYYPLFSQGASGFGDKDTWLAAAKVHQLPYYQVKQAPVRLGYMCNGKDRAVASCQHHPGDDYAVTLADARNSAPSSFLQPPTPRPMFVHGNLPKYDGPDLLSWDMPDWQDMQRCEPNGGKAHRLWGSKEMTMVRFGWDVEKSLWDSMRWVACEHERDFSIWTNGSWHSKPRENVCRDVVAFYEELLVNETYDASLDAVPQRPLGSGWSYWLKSR